MLRVFEQGQAPRHVLLVGPAETTDPIAEGLLDRGEQFKYHRFLGCDLSKSEVELVQDNLEGYPERILDHPARASCGLEKSGHALHS